jgi:hypothetical protein
MKDTGPLRLPPLAAWAVRAGLLIQVLASLATLAEIIGKAAC